MSRVALVITDQEDLPVLLSWAWRFARGADLPLNIIWWRKQQPELSCQQLPLALSPEPIPETSQSAGDVVASDVAASNTVESGNEDIEQTAKQVTEPTDKHTESSASTQGIPKLLLRLHQLIPQTAEYYRDGDEREDQLPTVWELRGPSAEAALSFATDEQDWSLVIFAEQTLDRGTVPQGSLLRFWQRSPCDMLVLRPGRSEMQPHELEDMLVPIAGGPNSVATLRWAGALKVASSKALHILPPGVSDVQATGILRIRRWLKKADQLDLLWQPLILQAKQPVKILEQQAAQHALIMMGSGERPFERSYFGSLCDRLVRNCPKTTIGVIHQARPSAVRWWQRIDDRLAQWLPRLDRERRIAVAERLMSGSRCNVDFLLLMSLATMLAGFGLIQSSAPVVVGAMLVAPLMSPLLGAGLSLVQANQQLLKQALRTLLSGFLIAVLLGMIMGLAVRVLGILDSQLSPELMARGSPSLIDLGVALVSGFAAAYAVVRNDLIAALAGVAIAAALVPPVATIGIAGVLGNIDVAQGAALLFATNVVAVIIGSSTALSLVGIGLTRSNVPLWLRRTLWLKLVLLVILAVPLTSVLLDRRSGEAPHLGLIRDQLTPWCEQRGWQLIRPEITASNHLRLHIAMPAMPSQLPWQELQDLLRQEEIEIVPVLKAMK